MPVNSSMTLSIEYCLLKKFISVCLSAINMSSSIALGKFIRPSMYDLNIVTPIVQECLCALVVDESEEVSTSAQEFLEFLFSSYGRYNLKIDVAEMLSRSEL